MKGGQHGAEDVDIHSPMTYSYRATCKLCETDLGDIMQIKNEVGQKKEYQKLSGFTFNMGVL